MKKHRYFKITGRVQGVGYRYYCLREAHRLGIYGYVKNLPDGSVEITAEADESVLEQYYALLVRGPSMGHVESVYCEDGTLKNYTDFIIEH